MSSRGSVIEEALPYDEAFLYHLSRGSEFLIANRVGEAKEELERALVVQPRDAKGQDLLAGVYFRLGVYPRAIELRAVLVEQHPADVPLRVNLGLALLKTAQLEEAVHHLTRATTLDEGHARAWGYLGLALWREGRLDRARDAFMRGGQASMARRMEEMLGISAGGQLAPSLSVAPPPMGESAEMLRQPTLPPLEWVHSEGSRASFDVSVFERSAERVVAQPTALDRWLPHVPSGASFAVGEGGVLVVTPRGSDVIVARERVIALRGAALSRGGRLHVAEGQVAMVRAADGESVYTLQVGDAESVYVVQERLLAFDAPGGGEVRTITAGATSLRVAAVRGPASVALSCPARPTAILTQGEPVSVMPERLLGWSGHLFPSAGHTADSLALTGDGAVLVV